MTSTITPRIRRSVAEHFCNDAKSPSHSSSTANLAAFGFRADNCLPVLDLGPRPQNPFGPILSPRIGRSFCCCGAQAPSAPPQVAGRAPTNPPPRKRRLPHRRCLQIISLLRRTIGLEGWKRGDQAPRRTAILNRNRRIPPAETVRNVTGSICQGCDRSVPPPPYPPTPPVFDA